MDMLKKHQLTLYLATNKHRIDGENWSCGFLGSRWCDIKLDNDLVRLCFYSRRLDEEFCDNLPEKYHYVLMIDPFK